MSEKVKGKQRSDSILRPALASPSKLETIPGSPATTVSGSVGHGSVTPPPPPPPMVTAEEKEKKEKEKRPLPMIYAPVPSVPIVPPIHCHAVILQAPASLTSSLEKCFVLVFLVPSF